MGDSYRPSRPDRDRPPALTDRMTFGNGDSYRPGSQFTFESTHPAPHFPPAGPPISGSRTRNRRGGRNRRNDNTDGASQLGKNDATGPRRGGRSRPPAPHERALLRHRDDGSPERTYGVSTGSNRFKDVEDLSDEAETDTDAANDRASKHKAPRTNVTSADGNTVPKWSNPDPYTALPPPSETTGIKKDLVQLLRKAKNEAAEKITGRNAVADNDDFISFGDDDNNNNNNNNNNEVNKLPDLRRGQKRKAAGDVPLLSEWKVLPSVNPSPWAKAEGTYDHIAGDSMKLLHNEICDFFEFVKPQKFEHQARQDLVGRISLALRKANLFPNHGGRVICFGSYAAGLYLPTADMDLVYTSDRHYDGGPPVLDAAVDPNAFRKTLYKAQRKLDDARVSLDRPVVIAKAKVPIIKFQDKMTRLDVDISFENLSGVQAQASFVEWKRLHPDLPVLVALVKQLLVMRGLNEVHSGGLGGFSIICLIVSYYQHTTVKTDNLGESFVGFLKYYGKDFNLAKHRIQMHPPAIVEKTNIGIDGRSEQPTGLSIQDPNKPDNNISGGSHKAVNVFKVFAAAHDILVDRMDALARGLKTGPSILACILGGNYDSYMKQRNRMKSLK